MLLKMVEKFSLYSSFKGKECRGDLSTTPMRSITCQLTDTFPSNEEQF